MRGLREISCAVEPRLSFYGLELRGCCEYGVDEEVFRVQGASRPIVQLDVIRILQR